MWPCRSLGNSFREIIFQRLVSLHSPDELSHHPMMHLRLLRPRCSVTGHGEIDMGSIVLLSARVSALTVRSSPWSELLPRDFMATRSVVIPRIYLFLYHRNLQLQ